MALIIVYLNCEGEERIRRGSAFNRTCRFGLFLEKTLDAVEWYLTLDYTHFVAW